MHKRQTDDEIFAVTSNNTVAAEAHYLPNCCCFYMKRGQKYQSKQINLMEFDYAEKESAANQDQLAFIRNLLQLGGSNND